MLVATRPLIRSAGILLFVALAVAVVPVLHLQVAFANPLPAGACCLPNGTCELQDPESCEAQGGIWNAYWSCDPNPCPPAVGACCLPDGSCQVVTMTTCTELGSGAWYGPDTNCNPNPCPPCLLPCGGACCFSDGHCEQLQETTCLMMAGTWLGSASDCTPSPCVGSDVEGPGRPMLENRSWGKIKRLFR